MTHATLGAARVGGTTTSPPVARTRRALRTNAAFTTVATLTLVAAADPVSELLATGRAGLVRLVGMALAIFAVDVFLASRAEGRRLASATLVVASADLAWVGASAATIAAGWYSTTGAATVAGIAILVGALGAWELHAWAQRPQEECRQERSE